VQQAIVQATLFAIEILILRQVTSRDEHPRKIANTLDLF